jgi:hypothetical protein
MGTNGPLPHSSNVRGPRTVHYGPATMTRSQRRMDQDVEKDGRERDLAQRGDTAADHHLPK